MNNCKNTCFFTGHRIIRSEHLPALPDRLRDIITRLSAEGITDFITGGALGFDTLSARAILEAKKSIPNIRLILALPCKNQTRGWNKRSIEEYNRILSQADEAIYVSEEYFNGCLHLRNRFMADNSSHCIFYLTSMRGGTAYTVRYALEKNLEMHNIML